MKIGEVGTRSPLVATVSVFRSRLDAQKTQTKKWPTTNNAIWCLCSLTIFRLGLANPAGMLIQMYVRLLWGCFVGLSTIALAVSRAEDWARWDDRPPVVEKAAQ